MRIEIKGRHVPISDELREHVAHRFRKIDKQVSEFALLELEVLEEKNPSIPESEVVHATLYLKGVKLRASSADHDLMHAINVVSDELAVQVKRHRDKRRKRRETRAAVANYTAGSYSGTPPMQAT